MKQINLKVNGMVCNGCENRVKNVLKNIEGVSEVTASYKSGVVTVTLNEEIAEDLIQETIENLGYEIIEED